MNRSHDELARQGIELYTAGLAQRAQVLSADDFAAEAEQFARVRPANCVAAGTRLASRDWLSGPPYSDALLCAIGGDSTLVGTMAQLMGSPALLMTMAG
jgi:hypothetical protein